ncbi:MAG: gliding motility-associated C-terminal domain-containing protein [Bacteroidales bacterium]
MKCLKNLLFIFLILLAINSNGQITGNNLVKNPSFEEYYSCPINTGELYKSKYWWGYSTDYYNSCSLSMGVPFSPSGFQYANIGSSYSGIIIYQNYNLNFSNRRETIKTKLINTLIKNKRYCTSLAINLAEVSYNHNFYIQLDSIGMLFTQNQVQDSILPICNNCAQIKKNISLLDTVNWLKINGSFIANGGEEYLTIGNFQDIIHWPFSEHGLIYIFIDDVSVCECTYTINLGPDAKLCEGDNIILNSNLPNATYTWQDSSHTATYEVKQPGIYWVRAYVAEYDITTYDTIVISAEDEKICNPPLIIPNFMSPNGDNMNDNFQLGNIGYYSVSFQIFNRWGNLIYQQDHYQNDYNGNGCASGVYYYLIIAKSIRNGMVKEYKGSVTVFSGK